MYSLLDIPFAINKSGKITKDVTFDNLTPPNTKNVLLLMSDVTTWIRARGGDGLVYFHFLPAGFPASFAVRNPEFSICEILSSGNNWQGDTIPSEAAANIYWFGN